MKSMLFKRRRVVRDGSRRRGGSSAGGSQGIEGLESRAMLAADDISVGLVGDRVVLTLDATGGAITNLTTGYQGVLPEKILLAGERLGGGFAADVGAFTVDNGAAANLLGVVMFDGIAGPDQFPRAIGKLDSLGIPVYQIAAPPQTANRWGRTTEQLVSLHPDQFVGVQFDDGSGVDAWITLAGGWINDMYGGYGPTNPVYGLYGNPNDGTYVANQLIVMGATGVRVLPAPPPVESK